MGWNSRGSGAPGTAQTVAKAFYEGRACKRGNCETDGTAYRLFGNVIARRNPNWSIDKAVAAKLLDEPFAARLEFTWCGYVTDTTARHLNALGCAAQRSRNYDDKPATMFGREVHPGLWYTPEELRERPEWTPAPKKQRAPRFVNMTAPLFA
jgi:hypothetical protein